MTTMSPSVVRSNADITTSDLLGFLEFHSIRDLRIHKDDLGRIFRDNGLDTKKFLPDKIHPHDAFRRATKEIESTIQINYGSSKNQKAKLLVREVKSDENFVIRHLVREVVNDKDERLDYNTIGRIILDRKTEKVSTDFQHGFLSEYPYDKVLETARDLYNEWINYHTRETINNITRRVINAMNHVSIMPNGKATFLPRTQRATLDALAGVIRDLAPYHMDKSQTSIIEIIPVIDTVEQRDMIARRAEADIQESANELIADFADLLSQEKVSVKAVKGYAERFLQLHLKLEEYEDIVHKKMDALQQQLNQAMERIRLELKQRS